MAARTGRPKKVVTGQAIHKIKRLAGLGCRLDEIAIACDVSPSTLDRWMANPDVKHAYQQGRIEATANVAERLYDLAMTGDVAACIFWLKAQAGWTDKPQPEPEPEQEQVHIYLPDNGR